MERVKFYSAYDISCGSCLMRSEALLNEYKEGKEPQDINDIIELHNILKFIDKKIYLIGWSPDDIKNFENVAKPFIGLIAKFFKLMTSENFVKRYNEVDNIYTDDFWELIEKFRVYENIAVTKFQELINISHVYLHELLKYKNTTEYFGSMIRQYMRDNCSTAELLLDKYEIKHLSEKEPLYLPKELSIEDKETIIENYIESEKPNLNYLRLIANIQSSKDKLQISPKILLKAKKKAEEQEKQFFHKDSGMLMETTVIFSKSQNEESLVKMEGQSITASYSTKWIENNTDYATLLNNFIFLFEFVDLQLRCILVNKFNQMSVFERYIFTSSENAYMKGIAFDRMNILSLLQIEGYYNELFSLGIRLEEVVEWFFKEYLSTEFNICNFKVVMPSVNSTPLEKCTNIMPAMESVLKQFCLFVQEGEIDFELLNIRSEHLIYKNIPSLIPKKYVYGVGDEYNTVTFLLFSDQSGLGYHEKVKKSYNNFFELICEEKSRLDDYPNYCLTKINWLLDNEYLSVDNDNCITFKNILLVMVLKDLYFNEVISYWRYPESGRTIMELLERQNLIEFESSLFSRPEQDYINYFLNKSQFNNGLDLRNRYSHTQLIGDDDERVHIQNYMLFFRLFILTVIKINDEFCTLYELKRK